MNEHHRSAKTRELTLSDHHAYLVCIYATYARRAMRLSCTRALAIVTDTLARIPIRGLFDLCFASPSNRVRPALRPVLREHHSIILILLWIVGSFHSRTQTHRLAAPRARSTTTSIGRDMHLIHRYYAIARGPLFGPGNHHLSTASSRSQLLRGVRDTKRSSTHANGAVCIRNQKRGAHACDRSPFASEC